MSDTFNIFDLALGVPPMLFDAPGMVRGALGMTVGRESRRSLGLIFQEAAHAHPKRPFLRFEDTEYTYREANSLVNRYAAVLTERGVGRGDVVGILMTNRPETLFVVLATVKLGATAGLLNNNQRDQVLAHSFSLLNSVVNVIGEECQAAVDTLPEPPAGQLPSAQLAALAATAPDADPKVCKEIRAHERAFLIFTSGTTGLPKASVMSHLRWIKGSAGLGGLGIRLRGNDTMYCCLPLYHNNALTVALGSVLHARATFALSRKFSASRFWDEVVATRSTAFVYIGELCRYLLNQEPRAIERKNRVRLVVGNGLRPELWSEFQRRFEIGRVVEFYGSSEGQAAFVNVFGLPRTAGFGAPPYAIAVVDEDTGKPRRFPDGKLRKVPSGGTGLLLAKVTKRSPFDGYTDPTATESKLVRDGFKTGDAWFDTGDLVRDQGWRHIAFADRLGDTFRWKGENVATTEVEGAFTGAPGVNQAVVYGVEVPGTDGKAGMAALTLMPGAVFDGPAVAAWLIERLPGYAVPLFVRVVDELESTTTFKSRKVELRKQGFSPDSDGEGFVLVGSEYVPFYPEYPSEVAEGTVR